VWELQAGPLQGRRFVGGYFPGPHGAASIQIVNSKPVILSSDPFRLDITAGTFVGLEERIFKELCALGRGVAVDSQVHELSTDETAFFYSAVSVLRDGSAIGPLEFFRPLEQVIY
jgi:hypothetical protein